MRETRRNFFVNVVLLSGSLAIPRGVFAAQRPPTPPPPPPPAQPPNTVEVYPNPAEAAAKRARLLQNEKEFREGVERLYQLTSDLRDTVLKTPAADVFSIQIVKQTEAIAKLAKLLKSKAKAA
ncbi:MAG TPA: hypothetical protein VI431_18630 [Candidatus Acidoferrum sp.]